MHATWPLGLGIIGFIIGIGKHVGRTDPEQVLTVVATDADAIAARYVSLFLQASAYVSTTYLPFR